MHSPGGPEIDPYVAGPALAVLGGVVSYIQRLKQRKSAVFSAVELVGECVVAGFVGYETLLICTGYYGMDPAETAALSGIAGHMGSRALYLMEKQIKRMAGIENKEV